MLWTIFVVLLVLWLIGMVSSYTLSGFIHLLLVVALVMLANQSNQRSPTSRLTEYTGESNFHKCGLKIPGRARGRLSWAFFCATLAEIVINAKTQRRQGNLKLQSRVLFVMIRVASWFVSLPFHERTNHESNSNSTNKNASANHESARTSTNKRALPAKHPAEIFHESMTVPRDSCGRHRLAI